MNTRILLIGQGLFLDGLTRILFEQPDIKIIAAVRNWDEAHEILDQEHPNIVIVNHDEPELRQSDLDPLLESDMTSLKVIYLTLTSNMMVVHNRQQLTDVSIPDLVDALQFPGKKGVNKS